MKNNKEATGEGGKRIKLAHHKDSKLSPYDAILFALKKCNYTIIKNDITKEIIVNGKEASEQELNSIYIRLVAEGCTAKVFQWQLFLNSNHIKSVNPVADYFAAFEGKEAPTGTIQKLVECLHLDHTQNMPNEVALMFLKKWLIGVVASVYGDYYNSIFPILIGQKGCGKTEFFRRLLPESLREYFAETKLTNGKDDEQLAGANLLIMVDEVDAMTRRKDAAALRQFISANYFSLRPPYGKQPIRLKRLASLCGTSNEMQIISDARNNRRLVPICITGYDFNAYNSISKDDLFHEAYSLFIGGEDWHFTKHEIEFLDKYSSGNAMLSHEAELIAAHYVSDEDSFHTAAEIAEELQRTNAIKISPIMIGRALSGAGFERIMKRVSGKKPVYGYKVKNINAPFI